MDKKKQQWAVFVLVTVFSFCGLSALMTPSIEPSEVVVLVNHRFSLTCTAPTDMNFNDLRLKFILRNGSVLPLHESYTKFVNENAILLEHPGLSSDFNGCYISCYTLNSSQSAEAKISIKEKHPLPRITKYEVWNWEELRFEWEYENRSNILETQFTAWFKDSSSTYFTKCEGGSKPNECIVKKKPLEIAPCDRNVHIMVNGTNKLENISADGILFPLFMHIRPGRVKGLNAKPVRENLSVTLVKFQAPKMQSIIYNISAICKDGLFKLSKEDTPVDVSKIKSSIDVPLIGLPADSNCTISVNGKPSQGGYWGPIETTSYRTLEAVPLVAPEMCRNCFQLESKGRNLRDAIFYFKPLSRDLARGLVMGYKVQYISGHSRCTELLDPSSFMLMLRNLSAEDKYQLTIEGRTFHGYNETLKIPVVVVAPHDFLTMSIKRFIVIIKNMTTVSTSWVIVENASSYTLFWCKRKESEQICADVLRWIELSSNYSSYDISLVPGNDYSNYLFGIGSSVDGHYSGIQWSDRIYDIHSFAHPPVIEYKSATAAEITFFLKRPPYKPSAGFIVKYVVYFCPVSEETSKHCTSKMQNVIVDGWTEEVRLDNLLPNQLYLILVESWTAAGSSAHNSSKVVLTGEANTIAAGYIVLICIAAVICVILVSVGLYSIFSFYRRSLQRYKQWLTVGITTPAGKTADTNEAGCNGEETLERNDYTGAEIAFIDPAVEEKVEAIEISTDKYEKQVQTLPTPLNLRRNYCIDIPLLTEERQLPPISQMGCYGSSPSVMLHCNKSIMSPDRQRILPTIRGQPAHVKPQKHLDDIQLETIPMVLSGEIEDLKENVNDSEMSESASSYAYVRQFSGQNEFKEMPLCKAASVKFLGSYEDCVEFSRENIKADNEEELEEREEMDGTNSQVLCVKEHIPVAHTGDSVEHLFVLPRKVC